VQALESIKDVYKHKDFLGLHFGHRWLCILGVPMGSQNFVTQFFKWGFILECDAY